MIRFLDWLLLRGRPGAMVRWGELITEFGVLWMTFGLLEEVRAHQQDFGWKTVGWCLLAVLIGLGAMRKGVKIRLDHQD